MIRSILTSFTSLQRNWQQLQEATLGHVARVVKLTRRAVLDIMQHICDQDPCMTDKFYSAFCKRCKLTKRCPQLFILRQMDGLSVSLECWRTFFTTSWVLCKMIGMLILILLEFAYQALH